MNVDLGRVQSFIDWLKTKVFLDARSSSAKNRKVKRGQVYRCNFGCGVGSEMQKDRPALVIQNDPANNSSGNTIVVPITHDKSTLPCTYSFASKVDSSGIVILDGQVNTSNVMCVSKARLGDYICDLTKAEMDEVDATLARTLDIMKHYNSVEKKLEKKKERIEQLINERNEYQDSLKEIMSQLEVENIEDAILAIKKLKNS